MGQTNETGAKAEAGNGERLNRRLFMFTSMAGVATATMGAAVVTVATTQPAQAQRCTDRDPYDPAGGGRWCRRRRVSCTDRDPYDPAGGGRWCRRRRVSCTDRDPYDPAGRGRWCR
jgi:hypothetical protein